MTLDQWMQERPELTLAVFGRQVGVSHSAVSKWRTRRLVPAWRQQIAIFYATDGAVTPNDWLPPEIASLSPSHDPRQMPLLVPAEVVP